MKLMQVAGAWLGRLGWRARIYAFAGLLTASTVAVGVVGGIAILYLNASIQEAVGKARERAADAANARLAVVGIDRAQARLVSAQTPEEIRREAVAAIRAASSLDESLQTLERTLAGNEHVAELVHLNQEVTSTRMAIIKAAKSNDSAKAQEAIRAISTKIARIEELSNKIYSDEQEALTKRVKETVDISHRVIFLLGVFVVAGVITATIISVFFSRQLSHSIGQILRTIGSVSASRNSQGDEVALGAHAGHLAAIAGEISSCETRMTGSVRQIKSGAQHVRDATDESDRQLDHAVRHIQQMAEAVNANAESIAHIVRQFEDMNNEMQCAIGTTQGLQRAVGQISAIANTIKEISSQTNLLALNAAIEAARAGDYGRGFAVVAGEVRNLATRTGQATLEIHAIAKGIDSEVGKAVTSLDRSATDARQYGDQLNRVLDISSSTVQYTATTRQLMDSVLKQMAMQRESVQVIQKQLIDVEATTALTQAQSSALREVSQSLSGSAEKLAQLADKVKL